MGPHINYYLFLNPLTSRLELSSKLRKLVQHRPSRTTTGSGFDRNPITVRRKPKYHDVFTRLRLGSNTVSLK